jgi:hypothetical protein
MSWFDTYSDIIHFEKLLQKGIEWVYHPRSIEMGDSKMDNGSLRPTAAVPAPVGEPLDVVIESPAIQRLIEEVRAEEVDVPRSYNRTFNRHNR